MQNNIPCQCIQGGDGSVQTPSILLNGLNGIVFCVALPLACLEVYYRGTLLLLRLVKSLSFICCIWMVLIAVVVTLFLCITIQCAAATLG